MKNNNISTNNNIISNMFKFSVNTWVSFFINFFVMLGTTYLFLPEELGKINMFITVSSMLLVLVPLGVDSSYLRFYYETPNNRSVKHLIIDGFLISGISTAFLVVVACLLKKQICNFIVGSNEYDILVLLFIYLIASVVLRFLNLTYRLEGDARSYTLQAVLVTVTSKALHSVAGFIWPYHRVSIYIIAISTLLLAVMCLKLQSKSIDFREYRIDNSSNIQMLKFGLPLLPDCMLIWLDSSVARFVIRKFLDFSDVGIYSAGVQLSALFTMISSGFVCFWGPFVYSNYKDIRKERQIKNMSKYIVIIALLFVSFIVLFQDLIFVFIGSKYDAAKIFFSFLFITPACNLISESTCIGITISKKSYWLSVISFITVLINIFTSLLLIKPLGLVGVAIASAISGIVMLILRSFIGNKYYKINRASYHVFISILFLILLCSLNYFLRFNIILRYIAVLLIILIEFLLYRKEVCYLIKMIISFITQTLKKKERKGYVK